MLEPAVIAYYATKHHVVFEPGIAIPLKEWEDYAKGIQRCGDRVMPLCLDADFDAIRKAFFGPNYWEGRTWQDEYLEKEPKYPPQTFRQVSTPKIVSSEK